MHKYKVLFLLLAIALPLTTLIILLLQRTDSPFTYHAAAAEACKREPVALMFFLDRSNSMENQTSPTDSTARFRYAQKATKKFVELMKPFDYLRGGLASYARLGGVDRNFTNNWNSVEISIDGLRTDSQNGTCLECALEDARQPYQNQNGTGRRKVALILSDGNINWVPDKDGSHEVGKKDGRDRAEILIGQMHRNNNIDFYTIGLGGGEDAPGQRFLRRVANDNGGSYRYAEDASKLEDLFNEIAQEILGGSLSGTVCVDTGADGDCGAGDAGLDNWEVVLKDEDGRRVIEGPIKTKPDGSYVFENLCASRYTVEVIPKSGYEPTRSLSKKANVNLGRETKDVDFGFIPIGFTGSISGCMFIDVDGDGNKDPVVDVPYPGQPDIHYTSPGRISFPSNGCYRIDGIAQGTNYNVRVETLPTEYPIMTCPLGKAYSFTIANDATCQTNPTKPSITCQNGNIINADFFISDSVVWRQVSDFNIRNDLNGFIEKIHDTSTNQCNAVAIQDGKTGNTPGIVYSGNRTANFSPGSYSSEDWYVNGPGTAYAPRSGELKTSFDSLLLTVRRNGFDEPEALPCDYSSCTIPSGIESKPYRVSGSDLTLRNDNIITSGKKVLIFVEGNLIINARTTVSSGSFLMFTVKDNIIVNNTFGSSVRSCARDVTSAQLQGIFSTDHSMFISGGGACPIGDRQLNIGGSVITNANYVSNGTLENSRTLCAENKRYPSLTITPRLDLLINTPAYMLRSTSIWKEVAP